MQSKRPYRKILVHHDPKRPHRVSDDYLVPVSRGSGFSLVGSRSGNEASTGRVVYTYVNLSEDALKSAAASAGNLDVRQWPGSPIIDAYLVQMSELQCGNLVRLLNRRAATPGFRVVAEAPRADITKSIRKLRAEARQLPIPRRLPTIDQVREVESRMERAFHPDLLKYFLEASDIWYGRKAPVTIADPCSLTFIEEVADRAWNGYGVPKALLPICEDNADFYCMNEKGQVVFWSHDGATEEMWGSLAVWMDAVWLGGERAQ